jgi:hypothetical protein
MIYTIFLLTVLDVALTTAGLNMGRIVEANPLMAWLITQSLPLTMMGVLTFTAAALWFINRFEQRYAWVRYGLWVVLASKVIAMIFHGLWILNIRW